MSDRRSFCKALLITVLAFGLVGALPVYAVGLGGTTITTQTEVDVLNSPDRTVFVSVEVERPAGSRSVVVDHYDHRAQNEDMPEDLGYGWIHVTAPRIGTQGVNWQEYDDGTPCKTCGPIDRVCGLLGDRC